jgi:16S rRNA (cytidine1402-2'-O)-methyltransferase
MPSAKSKLYLIPTLLGGGEINILPSQLKSTVETLDEFIVEDARSARRFLRAIGYKKNFDTEVTLRELDKHAEKQDCQSLLQNVLKGKNAGILSEAGNPCIADPGAEIVAYAHAHNIDVVPLVGPSSILLALISSGFNGQQFCFHGYLPIEQPERIKKIKELEDACRDAMFASQRRQHGVSTATQIFMETPFRNQKLLEDILKTCRDETLLCVACDLTLPTEFIKTKTIRDWKKEVPEINKRYCIFLMGR